ncbi:1,2-dihydroxy-3-keto-5-methylthiopentene dioxygenase [Marinobacter shengliensis]|jgi:1,2-dihydroxy-3-keto-5-methylthiopentene dioxygenase|uniref:1,2-dihydroxy-3-keto-5-methylthiopentene dioxygenase n=1 Tax=Marinobacter shengliensis TaxID=1389223 RepID=UPI00257381D3|nr:cupin [Marinobacter shengliensis]BEH15048.1 acireductone dioxygenase [Marinobacter shengliensis]
MTTLSIFHQSQPDEAHTVMTDPGAIGDALARHGVRFEQWPTRDLPADASQEQILEAYSEEVARLKQECGFQTADVISLNPDNPQKEAFRQKFLDEHTHSEDEVRFFVRGQGLFYLHFGDQVYALLCQQNDLISVPDGTRHWFDMGPEPQFTCIRLFTNPEGWVASFTGEDIASRLPRYEGLAGVAG